LQTSVALDAIDTMQDFVDNVENIDISNQMLSEINGRSLRRYASLIPDKDYMLWLDKSFKLCFEGLAKEEDQRVSAIRLTDILSQALEYTRYMKVCVQPGSCKYWLTILDSFQCRRIFFEEILGPLEWKRESGHHSWASLIYPSSVVCW
jgi:hypothetical protein